jgi:alpha-L-arabinofuranosidase
MLCAALVAGSPAQAAPVAQVVVDPSVTLAEIGKDLFGVNEPFFDDVTIPGIASWWAGIGVGLVRWPGGGGDVYHWRTNSVGPERCASYGGVDPHSTFDAFMTKLALPLGLDVVLGANYGSNAACTAGGEPSEAADWVDYANNVKHYGVKLWTIGNEQWADFSLDLHAPAHSPSTYAQNVANRYYPLMKARDPTIQIGIDLAAPYDAAWDAIVLKDARYDFVDIHTYVDALPRNDEQLLLEGPAQVEHAIAVTRSE